MISHASLNAILNAAATVLLLAGYFFIRKRRIRAHHRCMVTAFGLSATFLVSYVVYHFRVGSVPFAGEGLIRPVYFAILLTHIFLAALIVPLALVTLRRAMRKDYVRHKKLAHVTLPIWLYVSATGVLIYLLLYHLYPARSLSQGAASRQPAIAGTEKAR